MYAHCVVAVFALLIPLSFALIIVDAPASAIACNPIQFSWQGGTGPWLLRILSASAPNNAIDNLGTSTAPPFNGVVDASLAETTVVLSVQDSTGDSGQSSPFTIAHPGLGSACGSTQASGGDGSTPIPPPTGGKTDIGGGGGTANTSSTDGNGSGGDSSPGTTDTGTSTGGSGTSPPPQGGSQSSSPQGGSQSSSPQGGSQASSPQRGSQVSGDPSAASGSNPSPSAQNSSPTVSPDSSPSSSTSSSTSSTISSAQSPAAFNFDSASRSSSATITNSLGSPTFTLSDTVTGLGGQIQPASSVLQSGVSSTGTTGQDGASNNSFSKKNVMSGAIIGGIIAAVVCVLLGALCVLRWCRRRRNAPDTLSYPFSHTDTEASGSTPREMVGRSGYPASTFSSWGNHGDLDERAISPAAVSAEAQPLWEAAPGTIESRYQAAFTPGHAASSSIDRNDPSSHQRFRSRAPIPKLMADARHAGPSDSSAAIIGEQPYTTDVNDGPPAHAFDEIRPQAMPSWGTVHDMMAGRHPVVVGYPPPYTSK